MQSGFLSVLFHFCFVEISLNLLLIHVLHALPAVGYLITSSFHMDFKIYFKGESDEKWKNREDSI